MIGTPDRGVCPDIVGRNLNKSLGVANSDKIKIRDAVQALLDKGCGNKMFLGKLRRAASSDRMLTAKQLDALNNLLTKKGMTRISVAVYDKTKKKRRWESFKKEATDKHAELCASRPLRPPGR